MRRAEICGSHYDTPTPTVAKDGTLLSCLLGMSLRGASDAISVACGSGSGSSSGVSGRGTKIAVFGTGFDDELSPSFQGGGSGIMGLSGLSTRQGFVIINGDSGFKSTGRTRRGMGSLFYLLSNKGVARWRGSAYTIFFVLGQEVFRDRKSVV